MYKVCFFDTKPYDRVFFDRMAEEYSVEITYFESKLMDKTAVMARGYEVVVSKVILSPVRGWVRVSLLA